MSKRFGNSKFYQQQKQFEKRFNEMLTQMQRTLKQNPSAVKAVQRFRGCLSNPQNDDAGRLPIYALTPLAHTKSKYECVLALISIAVQTYWGFCNGGQGLSDRLDTQLVQLALINSDGLNAYKLTGEKYPGYSLEIK